MTARQSIIWSSGQRRTIKTVDGRLAVHPETGIELQMVRWSKAINAAMLINQVLTKRGGEQETTNKQRRILIGGAVLALISSSKTMMAEGAAVPHNPFTLIGHGIYQHVVAL